jgi:hypothetical protein
MRQSVVLPAPDDPVTARISPGPVESETETSASVAPKRFEISRSSTPPPASESARGRDAAIRKAGAFTRHPQGQKGQKSEIRSQKSVAAPDF